MLIKLIKTVCFLFEELSQWKRWLKTVERIVSFCNWLLTRNRVTHFFKALIKRKEKKLRPCDFQEWDFFCGSHFLKCHKTFLSLTVKQENHNLPPLFICEYCSHCRWYLLSYGTYACAFLQGGYSMSCMVTQELTMMDEWWLYLYMLKKISKENMFETHGLYLFLYFSIRETVQKTHSLAN